jgi:hypothetical protein
MNTILRLVPRVAVIVLACAAGAAAQQVDWSKKALQSERSRAYDALHYRIAIRLDLDAKSFAGETTITLTSLGLTAWTRWCSTPRSSPSRRW